MKITKKLVTELQNRLKVGNRRGIHLNAIPGRSRYKFDLARLASINPDMPDEFLDELLTQSRLKFTITWKDHVPDLNALDEEEQSKLIKINKSLENLVYQAETVESEKGINTFGFGFPLLVRRDRKDSKLTVAPILIWSLKIQRAKEFNTWKISRKSEDPIYLNEVLLNHLETDSELKVRPVDSDMLADGVIDRNELFEVCTNLLEDINPTVEQATLDALQNKFKHVTYIRSKKEFEKLVSNSSHALIHFGGIFSLFDIQKQNIINDYDDLMNLVGEELSLYDLENHEFQYLSSVETDPSQQSILHALEKKRNLLIQGPPGTGKSQTLTAILINALENKRKTLVVCEKRTALDVLYKSLSEHGLGDFCVLIKDSQRDRRSVVDLARIIEDQAGRYAHRSDRQALDHILQQCKNSIEAINKGHRKLEQPLFDQKNWTNTVGLLRRQLGDEDTCLDLQLPDHHFRFSADEFSRYHKIVREGQQLWQEFKNIRNRNNWNPDVFKGNNPYLLEEEIKRKIQAFRKDLEDIKRDIGKHADNYRHEKLDEVKTNKTEVDALVNTIEEIQRSNVDNQDFLDQRKTNSFLYKTLAFLSAGRKKTLADQDEILLKFKALANLLAHSPFFDAFSFTASIADNINKLPELKHSLSARMRTNTILIEEEASKSDLIDTETIYASRPRELLKMKIQSLARAIKDTGWLNRKWTQSKPSEQLSVIRECIAMLVEPIEEEGVSFRHIFGWYSFSNKLNAEEKALIRSLTNSNSDHWEKAFATFYLNRLLLKHASLDLPTDDKQLETFQKTKEGIRYEQLSFIKRYWRNARSNAVYDFDSKHEINVKNLYNKRASKRHKRFSLREIVTYEPDLFTTLFPVILTTPDVSSNLFKGMNEYFDLVMFDEASQLRLEDTLPAILKGKQKVISGDEHQMPPSNYFSKVYDGTIEDEEDIEEEDDNDIIRIEQDDILLGCESLLEFGTELSFEKQYLDFHYRSRHPYLIEFSNQAFYHGRLKPLPHKFDYKPIHYVAVDGTFSDHCNEAEAETVLSILEHNIHRGPNGKYPSVGIATFNISQRNLINRKIQNRRQLEKFRDFSAKIDELFDHQGQELFIKNLENIQGDERDVIILSTTYGPNPEGKFFNRFGPINHAKGYKLLNVIVTRAKYKLYVCSSIPQDEIFKFRDLLQTSGNNRRAVFFAYLAYAKAVSDEDEEARTTVIHALKENQEQSSITYDPEQELESIFEEEVYQVLAGKYEAKHLKPQFKFAGFRIDIVFDPLDERLPKIAIECDGAKYHSSREAYVYDYHRQKILEEHGFVFHRIWSTSWWRNYRKEKERLFAFIEKTKSESRTGAAPLIPDLASCFTDEVQLATSQILKHQSKQRELEMIKNIQKEESPGLSKPKVEGQIKPGDIVEVKYLNNDKVKTVKILDRPKPPGRRASNKKYSEIEPKTALAQALIGSVEGDVVTLSESGMMVEILRTQTTRGSRHLSYIDYLEKQIRPN